MDILCLETRSWKVDANVYCNGVLRDVKYKNYESAGGDIDDGDERVEVIAPEGEDATMGARSFKSQLRIQFVI